jgi:hypothetical protein
LALELVSTQRFKPRLEMGGLATVKRTINGDSLAFVTIRVADGRFLVFKTVSIQTQYRDWRTYLCQRHCQRRHGLGYC